MRSRIWQCRDRHHPLIEGKMLEKGNQTTIKSSSGESAQDIVRLRKGKNLGLPQWTNLAEEIAEERGTVMIDKLRHKSCDAWACSVVNVGPRDIKSIRLLARRVSRFLSRVCFPGGGRRSAAFLVQIPRPAVVAYLPRLYSYYTFTP